MACSSLTDKLWSNFMGLRLVNCRPSSSTGVGAVRKALQGVQCGDSPPAQGSVSSHQEVQWVAIAS